MTAKPAARKKSSARKTPATASLLPAAHKKRLIIGITGATGAMYGVRLLETLHALPDWETHLVVSDAGVLNAWQELGMSRKDLEGLADVHYNPRDIGAAIASGSFLTEGMVIAPCSMKTLAAVAHAHADDLISRAADVILKERRRLVLMTRETPLNLAHLRNMTAVTEMGGVIFPPVPAFYAKPESIDAIIAHTTARVLDLFGLHSAELARWQGMKKA
jgi:polyprenyl P-hydroxybenzoate/phenylacrylic acid decarboxylase-like protein